MFIVNFLELKEKFEIQKYVKPGILDQKNHISFSGSPRKHPNEPTRVILIVDPFSEHTFFYEFNIEDIAFVQELPSISNLMGESVSMVRVWVRKKSIAIQCTPFVVDKLI
ncbi:MAG: inorganic pyrophosphatase Ppa [Pseudomonadota bacterium]